MVTNNPIINEPHYGLSYHLCLNFLPFITEMLWMQTKVETMKIMFNATLNSAYFILFYYYIILNFILDHVCKLYFSVKNVTLVKDYFRNLC